MNFIDFSHPEVQASVISGLFSTVGTGIVGGIAVLISNYFRKDAEKVRKLENKLDLAI